MKKSLQILLAAVLFSPVANGQLMRTAIAGPGKTSTLTKYGTPVAKQTNENRSSVAVCNDKVTYVDNNGAGTINDYAKVGGVTGWDAAMQSFPDFTGSVTRIDFKAQSYTGTEIVQASIHAINANNEPIGTPLGSVNVSVNTTLTEYGANLPSAVNVTNGFAIVIWDLETGDSIKVMMNSDGDGQYTGFSNLFAGSSIYNVLSYFNADADFLMRPTIRFNTRSITLSASPSTLCAGQSVSFNYSYGSTPAHYGHSVYNPTYTTTSLTYGDATPNGTTMPISHTYANSGSFTASLIETYDGWTSNCASDPSTQSITVNPAPNSFFSWSATQLAVTFNNLSTAATTYAWQFGDAGTSAAPNPIHNYAASGSYTVELTATGPCGSDYSTTNITITDSTNGGNVGVLSIEKEMLVNLYPNPVNDMFTIQVETSSTEDLLVEVLSPLGQVVQSRTYPMVNNTAVAFNMSSYAAGTYFVRIQHGKSNMIKPVVKN